MEVDHMSLSALSQSGLSIPIGGKLVDTVQRHSDSYDEIQVLGLKKYLESDKYPFLSGKEKHSLLRACGKPRGVPHPEVSRFIPSFTDFVLSHADKSLSRWFIDDASKYIGDIDAHRDLVAFHARHLKDIEGLKSHYAASPLIHDILFWEYDRTMSKITCEMFEDFRKALRDSSDVRKVVKALIRNTPDDWDSEGVEVQDVIAFLKFDGKLFDGFQRPMYAKVAHLMFGRYGLSDFDWFQTFIDRKRALGIAYH